jgi:hypothetical protein
MKNEITFAAAYSATETLEANAQVVFAKVGKFSPAQVEFLNSIRAHFDYQIQVEKMHAGKALEKTFADIAGDCVGFQTNLHILEQACLATIALGDAIKAMADKSAVSSGLVIEQLIKSANFDAEPMQIVEDKPKKEKPAKVVKEKTEKAPKAEKEKVAKEPKAKKEKATIIPLETPKIETEKPKAEPKAKVEKEKGVKVYKIPFQVGLLGEQKFTVQACQEENAAIEGYKTIEELQAALLPLAQRFESGELYFAGKGKTFLSKELGFFKDRVIIEGKKYDVNELWKHFEDVPKVETLEELAEYLKTVKSIFLCKDSKETKVENIEHHPDSVFVNFQGGTVCTARVYNITQYILIVKATK